MVTEKSESDALLKRAYSLSSQEESRELYKDWAETYDETMLQGLGYLSPAKTANLLVEFLPDRNARILDVGSGTGFAGVELARLGFKNMDALDYSAEMLAIAAKRSLYTGLHEIDLTEEIPLATGAYEALISTGTFTHAHVGAGCLDELFRVLKPGGLFACTVHRDIWEPEGFAAKVAELESRKILTTRFREADTYFADVTEKEGWNVVMVDRDGDELEKVATPLSSAHAITADVSQPNEVIAFTNEITKRWGRLDALVNNAGVADFGPMEETTFERWRTVMETNLDGVFLVSQASTPLLKLHKGAIVNIASISGLRASTLRTAYGTSKAAVIQLSLQQVAELGEYGIRANCICPGPVRTKLAMAVHTQDIIDAYHDAIPLNRYGSEEEIANAIIFLCSDKASYITGQVLAADGGFEATGVGLPALRK